MKLTLQNIYGATIVLAGIIRNPRVMSQKAKYRIARLHSKLLPEFNLINARRDELIKSYNTHQTKTVTLPETGAEAVVPTDEWMVPEDKMEEFTTAWIAIGNEEIEVEVQPIDLSCLSMNDETDGAIESSELVTLGGLVSE